MHAYIEDRNTLKVFLLMVKAQDMLVVWCLQQIILMSFPIVKQIQQTIPTTWMMGRKGEKGLFPCPSLLLVGADWSCSGLGVACYCLLTG